MPFIFETSLTHQWPTLQTEHDILVSWIKQPPNSGFVGYLDHRVADTERKIALYYVEGIGMGDGMRFALVYANELIWFDVLKVWGAVDFSKRTTTLRIGDVDIPEVMLSQREKIKSLLAEALAVYDQNYPFEVCPTQLTLNYQETQWTVIPTKFSWLYWTTQSEHLWSKHKATLKRNGTYLSPKPLRKHA